MMTTIKFKDKLYLVVFTVLSVLLIPRCGKDDPGNTGNNENMLTASFEVPSGDIFPGQSIAFTNTSQNATAYEWDFGDNTTSSDKSPSHTYNTAGTYDVELIASNAENESKIASQSITIMPREEIIASFTIPTGTLYTETDIAFQNTSSGANSYTWQFGDGQSSTEESPIHQYTNAGNFEVTLSASNGTESKDTKVTVVIEEKPAPIVITNCNQFGDLTWTDHNPFGVDYIIDCDFSMVQGDLLIEENTIVEFGDDAKLIIQEQATIVTNDGVVFTGKTKTPGSWGGVRLNKTRLPKLKGTTIEYAGSMNVFVEDQGNTRGALFLSNVIPEIDGCTIKHSSSNGIVTDGLVIGNLFDQPLAAFSNISISDCQEAGFLGHVRIMPYMKTVSVTNCGFENSIVIYESTLETNSFPVPANKYFLTGSIRVESAMEVEAGAELVLGTGINIVVAENGGQLEMKGTPNEKIIVRGEVAGTPSWGAIAITSGRECTFEYCEFIDGGVNAFPFVFNGMVITRQSMIWLNTSQDLNVFNCEFKNAPGCAMASLNQTNKVVTVNNTYNDIPLSGFTCNIL